MTRIDEIKARLGAATPGPWRHNGGHKVWRDNGNRLQANPVARAPRWRDARLIANAPADLAWLVGEVERLRDGLAVIAGGLDMDGCEEDPYEVGVLQREIINVQHEARALLKGGE